MARTIDTGNPHKFIHKRPNMYLNDFSITVDGDTATCKTKFDKNNTHPYEYSLSIFVRTSEETVYLFKFPRDGNLNTAQCHKSFVSKSISIGSDRKIHIGIECSSLLEGNENCAILGSQGGTGILYTFNAGNAPSNATIKVVSAEPNKTYSSDATKTNETDPTKGSITLEYSYKDGKPSCNTKWIKCYDVADNNKEVATVNISGTNGKAKFSGLKLGKDYKFKLYVKNSEGSSSAECTGSVGIPCVKIYQETDHSWHNAIAYIYQETDHRWHKAVPLIYNETKHEWHRTATQAESPKQS